MESLFTHLGDASSVSAIVDTVVTTKEVLTEQAFSFKETFFDLLGVIKDVAPILIVIFFFQYMIIKKSVPHLPKIVVGIVMVILGLYAFIVGLEMGLFPIGESIAFALTSMGNNALIYLFAFLIGFFNNHGRACSFSHCD